MGPAQLRPGAKCALIAAAGGAVLAGCATPQSDGAGSAALFKAEVGDIAGGVAPGPHSVWYVRRQPVAYVKMGFATWQPDRSRGLRGWFARHFGRHDKASEPTGVAAASLGLPVPSRVQVTNVASGQVVTVRIDDKAPLGDAVVRLSPEAAHGLGVEPGKPLLVRMRYLAPVMAYRERPTLRYALRGPQHRAPVSTPAAPAPTVLAAQAKPAPAAPIPGPVPAVVPSAARPAAPAVIRVAETHPAPPLRAMEPAPPARLAATPAPVAGDIFRVQAGAFANLDNARRAVTMLAHTGAATIEPTKRGAVTLYRVIVPGPRDAQGAARLKARVAEAGFADARLIHPL